MPRQKATYNVILSGAKNLGEFLVDSANGNGSQMFRFAQHNSAIYQMRIRIDPVSNESADLDFDDPILD